MFGSKKKKTPVEKARQDIERQLRVVNKQAAETRKDFVKRLNRTAKELRADVNHMLGREEQHRADQVAEELERIAANVEKTAERRFDEVTEQASDHVWTTVVVAFVIGILLGIIMKNLSK